MCKKEVNDRVTGTICCINGTSQQWKKCDRTRAREGYEGGGVQNKLTEALVSQTNEDSTRAARQGEHQAATVPDTDNP